ncbi:uncharacterized protein MELLADRAFT_105629 [Melampsora larici-populina 98AG31]|uniref:Uncharacterized protein n=1 Tax=Melampsora larici-populina (strain 98AG31 / pathotype 3-4-7) TaxID=747676 RepID=F4RIU8_MELLP|nr:uncharacterized protein MELLADRAFT_105629 [Melampsora larici-populina 98AG31]EGG07770.1 hypothetical protein MELLADRAFT_105629 [Melampsora larici-populina 98AG31]
MLRSLLEFMGTLPAMSSQQSHSAAPYLLSTPSMGRIDRMSSTLLANRGQISGVLGDNEGNVTTRKIVSTEKILAAIATLSTKMELDIAHLYDKLKEEVALSNDSVEHYHMLSNNLD